MRRWILVLAGALAGCEAADGDGGDDTDAGDTVVETDTPADTDAVDTEAPADTDDGDDTDTDTDTVPVDTDDPPPATVSECFADAFFIQPADGPDYDQYAPTVGRHCFGTNHQDIDGIERVVFLGDSVTVGTPPTPTAQYYRNRLAKRLGRRFGLKGWDNFLWQTFDPFSSTTLVQESGDFASCARFGARTDDFLRDGTMIEDCFPEAKRRKRTLVVLTMGGNDIAAITSDGLAGEDPATIWPKVEAFVELQEQAIRWFTDDPARFPNGVFVIFANMHEFTDGTGDTSSCITAPIAGFGGTWPDPQALTDMVVWANEQYLRIAVETGTDMVFMLEEFCGHGWRSDDPTAPCYRGPNTPRWIDLTCIHPNPDGHLALTDMFEAVVAE